MRLRQVVPCLALLAVVASTASVDARGQGLTNPIVAENALPGTPVGAAAVIPVGHAIEAYASQVSALPGDTLQFHVSTSPVASYRVEVYRLGWYGGAGARLVGCTPTCAGWRTGQELPLPAPDANGLVQAGWPVTDTFSLPANATTGYYRVRFVLMDGRASATYVIVRPPPGYQARILVQVPVNTWQAYNPWGGRSLYDLAGLAVEANRVSFDRPYYVKPLESEYPLLLFLERQGYDVAYQTDVDTDANPSSLLGYRLVIVAGHSEYWTSGMRNAFEAARDAGVNLAFMGSNAAYWQVRYENGGRVIVGYKSTADPVTDPSLQTILFRALDPPRPECELIGIQHQGGGLRWSSGDFSIVPDSLDYPWFAGTGFDASSVLKGLVGIETDTIPNNMSADNSCGNQLTVFFHREMGGDTLGNADMTAYTAPSGSVVFAAGSRRLAWGLADGSSLSVTGGGLVDPRLQRFIENMIDDLSTPRSADLSVSLTAVNTPSQQGAVKFDAVIANAGPDDVRRPTIDLTLPRGSTFVRVASKLLRCSIGPLRCTLDELPAGASVSAVFVVRSVSSGAAVTAHVYASTATNSHPARARAVLVVRKRASRLGARAARHS
jgi:hypothetical protein